MNSQNISQYDHFLPVSTSRLIAALQQTALNQSQIKIMHKLNQLISFEFYQKLVKLKKDYLPYNPDRELLLDQPEGADASDCINSVKSILMAANFSELNQQQIEYALLKTSPYGLEIQIDLSAFEDVSLFYRGKSNSSIEIRDWKSLYLKKKSIGMIQYQRLFLLLRYKDQQYKPGIHFKLFKNIPSPDLEMLFPECKIRMKLLDKVKLAVTGGGGTAGGLLATIGKVTAAVSPWTIVVAVGGFGMLIWRQISKIFIQRTRYMATLAQNLYFHTLDNNAGAITFLVDLARQEEIKEVILAYAILNLQNISSVEQLDSACEDWFLDTFNTRIDFDVSDAVRKLRLFNILTEDTATLSCRDSRQIIENLNTQWQAFI